MEEATYTIYPCDLTPECRARLAEALKTRGESLEDTNWDAFGCAQIILPTPQEVTND